MAKPKRKSNKIFILGAINEGASTYREIEEYAKTHGRPDLKKTTIYSIVNSLEDIYVKSETRRERGRNIAYLSITASGRKKLKEYLTSFKISEKEEEQKDRHNFRFLIRELILSNEGISTTSVIDNYNLTYKTLGGRKMENVEIIEEINSLIDSEELKFSKGGLHYSNEHFINIIKTGIDTQRFVEIGFWIPFEKTLEKSLNGNKERSMRFIRKFLKENSEYFTLERDIFSWFVEE